MTAKELIVELSKLPQNKQVILFDENSIPYEVERVVCDTNHDFDHVVIKSLPE